MCSPCRPGAVPISNESEVRRFYFTIHYVADSYSEQKGNKDGRSRLALAGHYGHRTPSNPKMGEKHLYATFPQTYQVEHHHRYSTTRTLSRD